jgi:NFU1 iron-sulfur cluster scaffold homolog, mitochondrial
MTPEELDIYTSPTPNPQALKFILNFDVKKEGSSTYRTPMEARHNPFATELFMVRGVDQLHFFSNTITVTKFAYETWENLEDRVMDEIKKHFPQHNANYEDPNPEKERRAQLSPELQKIEEIIDRTIRPGLQGDGGDLECLEYKDKVLVIKYQGACGTCPSSSTGTLEAIKGILRDEFDPEIEVYAAPA